MSKRQLSDREDSPPRKFAAFTDSEAEKPKPPPVVAKQPRKMKPLKRRTPPPHKEVKVQKVKSGGITKGKKKSAPVEIPDVSILPMEYQDMAAAALRTGNTKMLRLFLGKDVKKHESYQENKPLLLALQSLVDYVDASGKDAINSLTGLSKVKDAKRVSYKFFQLYKSGDDIADAYGLYTDDPTKAVDRLYKSQLEGVYSGPKIEKFDPPERPRPGKVLDDAILTGGLRSLKDKLMVPPKVSEDFSFTMIGDNGEEVLKTYSDAKYPDPDKDGVWVKPHYAPVYQILSVDVPFFKFLIEFGESKKLTKGLDFKGLLASLADTANKFYLGNGNMAAQIGRMLSCAEVAKSMSFKYNKDLVPITASHIAVLERHLKMKPATVDLNKYATPFEVMMNHPALGVIKVNKDADSGPAYPGKKRADTYQDEMVFAVHMFEEMAAMDVPTLRTWLKDNAWMKLVNAKPKIEVYERSDWLKKARNYFNGSHGPQIPEQVLLSCSFHEYVMPWHDKDNWSLLGFSPYGGGMDHFVRYIRAGIPRVMIYSDNIYIVFKRNEEWFLASIDISKAESCIGKDKLQLLNRYLCEKLGIDREDVNGRLWWLYGQEVHPFISTEQVALLLGEQIKNPGMGSGINGTAAANQVTSTLACHFWTDRALLLKEDGTWELNESGKTAFRAAGIKPTVEHVLNISTANWESGERVKLDLIGFDCVYTGKIGIAGYAPLLSEDRLRKTLMFQKSQKADHALKKLLNYQARMFSCFILGAWLDPLLNAVVRARIAEVRTEMADFLTYHSTESIPIKWKQDALQSAIAYTGENTEEVGTIMNDLILEGVPDLLAMVKIVYGNETADSWYAKLDPENQVIVKEGGGRDSLSHVINELVQPTTGDLTLYVNEMPGSSEYELDNKGVSIKDRDAIKQLLADLVDSHGSANKPGKIHLDAMSDNKSDRNEALRTVKAQIAAKLDVPLASVKAHVKDYMFHVLPAIDPESFDLKTYIEELVVPTRRRREAGRTAAALSDSEEVEGEPVVEAELTDLEDFGEEGDAEPVRVELVGKRNFVFEDD